MPPTESIYFYSVAVAAPLFDCFSYFYHERLNPGDWVMAPLGHRNVTGIIIQEIAPTTESEFKIKAISEVLLKLPRLKPDYLQWLQWLSKYYIYPLGLVGSSVLPPLPKTDKLRKSKRASVVPHESHLKLSAKLQLTSEQQNCLDAILKLSLQKFHVHLVFGVTGSGKTEVYLHLIDDVLKLNKTALVIVPEISLTPQLIERFSKRFGPLVAVIHSHLTEREKTNQWWNIVDGEKKILIGARSALFCPLPDLGIIVVDEEHEPSYKQDEKLKYHARDAAIMLGHFQKCPVILGSATPSLESWYNAHNGKYTLHTLSQRATKAALPHIQLVDLKKLKRSDSKNSTDLPFWLTPILHQKIMLALQKQHQVGLFLNRRGLAQVVMCPSCGFTKECPSCDINLTLHAHSHLVCHYCDYHENYKIQCPSCLEGELQPLGLGTEKVEEDLKRIFPTAQIARADRDEIQDRLDLESFIQNMEDRKIDIVIGTQMIAKGLDFPHLKLVGILMADIGFNIPDFRAAERSFQILTQMSGRSGRHNAHDDPGEVIIQAYNLDHPSLKFTLEQDYFGFVESELKIRQSLHYPPFGKLVNIRVQSKNQTSAFQTARLWSERAWALKKKNSNYENMQILGPTESPLSRIRGHYRYHLMLKTTDLKIISAFLTQLLSHATWVPKNVKTSIDVDPIHLL